MYSVLLIDDDTILLSGIKRLIDWEKNNCRITGTASNGNEAMKKIRHLQPDLVLCDIVMPDISGMDVLKQTEAEFPGVIFIMLTNQEDFGFARESLHYRAAEYLIKNNLSQEILENALAHAIKERENRKKLFRIEEADELSHTRMRQEQICNALANFLYTNAPLREEEQALLKEEGMFSRFAFALIPLNFSILPEYPEIPAEEQKRIFDWETEITGHLAAAFFPRFLLLPNPQNARPDPGEGFNESLLLFAWDLQPQAWEADIARFRERLVKTSGQITRLGIDVIPSGIFALCDTAEVPRQALRRIEDQYYRMGKGTHSETIQKAIQYILNNVEKQIRLQDVANFACISPGYLSTLFKREYNQNLIDFINQTKIDRACELLREKKLRINEISYILGYENAFYFSRVFRQYTGSTPSEFKEKWGGS